MRSWLCVCVREKQSEQYWPQSDFDLHRLPVRKQLTVCPVGMRAVLRQRAACLVHRNCYRAPVTESTAATGGRIQTFIHKKLWLHSLVITSRNMEIYTVMRHRWISCLLYIHFRHNTWSNYAHMHFLKILAINVLEYNGTYMESPYSQQGILCYKCHKGRTGQNNLHRESKLMLF